MNVIRGLGTSFILIALTWGCSAGRTGVGSGSSGEISGESTSANGDSDVDRDSTHSDSSDDFPTATGGAPSGGPATIFDDSTDKTLEPTVTNPIVFTQAVGGAMWANPDIYEVLPIRLSIVDGATPPTIELQGTSHNAQPTQTPGRYLAMVPIQTLSAGNYILEATTSFNGIGHTESVELVVGNEGIQFTDWYLHGSAATPKLHRRGHRLYLSWVASYDSFRSGWLQEIDGAGRPVSARTQLTPPNTTVWQSFVAFGEESIGILYRTQSNGDVAAFFTVMSFDGHTLLPTVEIITNELNSTGDPNFIFGDGFFTMIWRTYLNSGEGSSIQLMRVKETDLSITGPSMVVPSGDEITHGQFTPFARLGMASSGDNTLITYARKVWHTDLDMFVPAAQYQWVDNEGSPTRHGFFGAATDYRWQEEVQTFTLGDEIVSVWREIDLLLNQTVIPTNFAGLSADKESLESGLLGGTAPIVEAEGEHSDPFILEHPKHDSILLWLDLRARYDSDANSSGPGTSELSFFAAPLSKNLAIDEHLQVAHARFIQGTPRFSAVLAGQNVIASWIDARHGNGILSPRPTLYLETIWY